MEKEIVQEDLQNVSVLIQKVLGTDRYAEIERMGGLTNHTYKVVLEDGSIYAVRIPGEGTEKLIIRSNEKISTELACRLKIDADLLYFGADGSKVTHYIPNAVTMSAKDLKNPENIRQAADIFRTLHGSNADTKVSFEVFDMAAGYEAVIKEKQVSMYDDYVKVKDKIMRIKHITDEECEIKKVPCHNDPLCENWVKSGKDGRMYLIDWEYAGMNDGMWDLADISIEAEYDDALDEQLLEMYFERKMNANDRKHFLAAKIYVDYLWTLWAKARVPYEGQPMEDWTQERYIRLKQNIGKYHRMKTVNNEFKCVADACLNPCCRV